MKRPTQARRWSIALGVTAGAATFLFYAWRGMRARRARPSVEPNQDPATSLQLALDILRADPALQHLPLHFVWLAPGILDVSGTVDTVNNERRAIALLRGLSGARTVLNRLVVTETVSNPLTQRIVSS
jgi:hypothetical protein